MREQVDNCQRCLIQTGCNNPPHMWKNILLFSAKVRSAPSQWGTVQAQLGSDILDLQNLISHKGWQNFFFFYNCSSQVEKGIKIILSHSSIMHYMYIFLFWVWFFWGTKCLQPDVGQFHTLYSLKEKRNNRMDLYKVHWLWSRQPSCVASGLCLYDLLSMLSLCTEDHSWEYISKRNVWCG